MSEHFGMGFMINARDSIELLKEVVGIAKTGA